MLPSAECPGKRLHVIIGTPDEENCPICKAHANDTKVLDEALGSLRAFELRLDKLLRCPCPLCTEARKEAIEE